MPAVAPTPYVFTSDTVRIISIDYSTFPTCSVNDGGTITSVSFTQLFNYVSQSDGDFFILDLSVNLEFIGYPNVRIYQHPENYMPLSALPSGYNYVNGVFTAPETSTGGTVTLSSLNGNGGEYIDGVDVVVVGREPIYTVKRSYFALYQDNAYLVMYDVESTDGHKLTVPESLLTKYVAPTTTP